MHKILQDRESSMAESVGKTENILSVKFSMNMTPPGPFSLFFFLLSVMGVALGRQSHRQSMKK